MSYPPLYTRQLVAMPFPLISCHIIPLPYFDHHCHTLSLPLFLAPHLSSPPFSPSLLVYGDVHFSIFRLATFLFPCQYLMSFHRISLTLCPSPYLAIDRYMGKPLLFCVPRRSYKPTSFSLISVIHIGLSNHQPSQAYHILCSKNILQCRVMILAVFNQGIGPIFPMACKTRRNFKSH